MLNEFFQASQSTGMMSLSGLAVSTVVSLLLGMGTALVYMYRNTYTKGFVITLATMPAMIQIVIMMVNGNVGAGVAVLGAFSLVRFRSVAGGAREISSIFFAMSLGLTTAMGYNLYAIIFFICIAAATLMLVKSSFGNGGANEKELRITIAENLDYEGLFDDVLEAYTKEWSFMRVRTTNMGSFYELDYHIKMRGDTVEKEFLDTIRCRNGNLNITCGRIAAGKDEL